MTRSIKDIKTNHIHITLLTHGTYFLDKNIRQPISFSHDWINHHQFLYLRLHGGIQWSPRSTWSAHLRFSELLADAPIRTDSHSPITFSSPLYSWRHNRPWAASMQLVVFGRFSWPLRNNRNIYKLRSACCHSISATVKLVLGRSRAMSGSNPGKSATCCTLTFVEWAWFYYSHRITTDIWCLQHGKASMGRSFFDILRADGWLTRNNSLPNAMSSLMSTLCQRAASLVGASMVSKIDKMEGSFKKAQLLTMDDKREVIAKLSCSNAGPPH